MLLSIFVVDVDVLCALMKSMLTNHVERWFIVCLKMVYPQVLRQL
jgi:hypothetical protein